MPLDSSNPSTSAIGDFAYAGGLALTSSQTDQLHGLSDLEVTGTDGLTVVGDMGVFFDARLVFDGAGRLAGLADTRLTLLTDESGKVLYFEGTPIPTSLILVVVLAGLIATQHLHAQLPLGEVRLGPWALHPLVLMYLISGSAMISARLRVPKP